MNPELRRAVVAELIARGYSVEGEAPHGTMRLGARGAAGATHRDELAGWARRARGRAPAIHLSADRNELDGAEPVTLPRSEQLESATRYE